jgi:hypothetical protein
MPMSPETQTSSDLQAEWTPDQLPAEFRLVRSRIMYIECKAAGLEGPARVGRVYFSKTGKTLYYRVSGFVASKVAVSRRTTANWVQGMRVLDLRSAS